MRRLLLILLVATGCLAQNTSLSTIQFPGTLPAWGGFLGAGTVLTPTDFNTAMCRLTDGNTEFSFDSTQQGANFGVNYDGSNVDHRINSNQSLIAIARNGGNYSLIIHFSFNGTVCTATVVYKLTAKDVAFSAQATHPLIAYDVETGVLNKVDFGETGGCTLTAPCKTVLHNFTTGTCLTGLTPTSNSVFLPSHSDTFFAIGFSNNQGTGGQGTGTIVATYKIGSGESVYNTGSATVLGIPPSSVCGDYGVTSGVVNMVGSNCPAAGTGTCGTCTGSVACPDQTTYHEVYGSPNDTHPWLLFDLGSALLCTNCGSDSDWIWVPGTLNVMAVSFSGHHTEWYTHVIFANGSPTGQNSIMQVIDSSGNLINPPVKLTIASTTSPNNLPSVGTPHFDSHLLGQNADPNDTNDVYLTNTNYYLVGGQNNLNNAAPNGISSNQMPGIQCLSPTCTPTSNPIPGFSVNELESIHLTNPPGNGTPCASSPCTTLPYSRWVHTGNDVVSALFNPQNSIAVMDPSAKVVAIGTTGLCGMGDTTNDANIICGGPDWVASNSTYVVGNIISPLTATGGASNATYVISACTGSCVSSSAHPTWLTADTTDNNITWHYKGIQNAREDVILVCIACQSLPSPVAPAVGLFAIADLPVHFLRRGHL